MRGIHPRKRTVLLATLAVLAGAVCLIVAAPQRKPMREQMPLNEQTVSVDYKTAATSGDLGLPFYKGARVENSFSYRITTTDGKPVTYYAAATLVSTDAAEKVSQDYSSKLPGKPKADLLDDTEGKRYVLAVGSKGEVRKVTIVPQSKGCRIELTRATSPSIPAKPLKPRRGDKVA